MKWLGVQRRTTDTDPRPGAAVESYNNRLGIEGENRRRPGMASTTIPKQSGAVLNIQPPIGPAGGIIVFPTGGTLFGFQDPLANWDDGKETAEDDVGWNFPAEAPPVGWTLPEGHTDGYVYLDASTVATIPDGTGVIFSVYFDGVLSYTSACMENGTDPVAIPPGTVFVNVTAVYGCNAGPDETFGYARASGL